MASNDVHAGHDKGTSKRAILSPSKKDPLTALRIKILNTVLLCISMITGAGGCNSEGKTICSRFLTCSFSCPFLCHRRYRGMQRNTYQYHDPRILKTVAQYSPTTFSKYKYPYATVPANPNKNAVSIFLCMACSMWFP